MAGTRPRSRRRDRTDLRHGKPPERSRDPPSQPAFRYRRTRRRDHPLPMGSTTRTAVTYRGYATPVAPLWAAHGHLRTRIFVRGRGVHRSHGCRRAGTHASSGAYVGVGVRAAHARYARALRSRPGAPTVGCRRYGATPGARRPTSLVSPLCIVCAVAPAVRAAPHCRCLGGRAARHRRRATLETARILGDPGIRPYRGCRAGHPQPPLPYSRREHRSPSTGSPDASG